MRTNHTTAVLAFTRTPPELEAACVGALASRLLPSQPRLPLGYWWSHGGNVRWLVDLLLEQRDDGVDVLLVLRPCLYRPQRVMTVLAAQQAVADGVALPGGLERAWVYPSANDPTFRVPPLDDTLQTCRSNAKTLLRRAQTLCEGSEPSRAARHLLTKVPWVLLMERGHVGRLLPESFGHLLNLPAPLAAREALPALLAVRSTRGPLPSGDYPDGDVDLAINFPDDTHSSGRVAADTPAHVVSAWSGLGLDQVQQATKQFRNKLDRSGLHPVAVHACRLEGEPISEHDALDAALRSPAVRALETLLAGTPGARWEQSPYRVEPSPTATDFWIDDLPAHAHLDDHERLGGHVFMSGASLRVRVYGHAASAEGVRATAADQLRPHLGEAPAW